MELIWFGSKSKLANLKQLNINLNICSVVVEPTDSVRDLGVILDSKPSMYQHIDKLSSTSFFHRRRLRHFRRMLNPSSRQRLVSGFILSRIDFRNAVLAGPPACMLAPLQRILNAAAQFVAGLPACAHVTNTMQSLHWLPVAYRIHYKLCLVMYAVYNSTSPSYIADTTARISTLSGRVRLRSANTSDLTYLVPWTTFGVRAFSVAGPREWNTSPIMIRNITEVPAFKLVIKTHFLKWHILTHNFMWL